MPLSSAGLVSFLRVPALPPVTGGLAVVTGASSGIGALAAAQLVERGFRVVGTSRSPGGAGAGDALPGVDMRALDLADPASIAAFADTLDEPATVVVNNAGESQSGPVEELPREALERLMQVNVLGHVELTQRLLPAMRANGRGRIVMVGSMLGSFPLAYRGSYAASKAALKAFGFSLRREVRGFGIGVSVVEPGAINTGISLRRTKYVDPDGPYAAEFDTMISHLDANEATGISTAELVETLLRAVDADRPRAFYAAGSSAPTAFAAQRALPAEIMHNIVHRRHGL